jgi:hypothetical protein
MCAGSRSRGFLPEYAENTGIPAATKAIHIMPEIGGLDDGYEKNKDYLHARTLVL